MVKTMAVTFVSEPLTPLEGSFDTSGMARGEPGLPRKFRWRKRDWEVGAVLERWKKYGDCRHGSGERYVRQHGFKLQTTDGIVLTVCFQRSFGKTRNQPRVRWWVRTLENAE